MREQLISERDIDRAAAVLRGGGLVAFPTETYYGLAVDPFNEQALARLFQVKRRPEQKPILVLIADNNQLELLVSEIPPSYKPLIKRFWPGALTLIFPALASLPRALTAGTNTVGVRRSPHPVAEALTRGFKRPITATSANLSGQEPVTCGSEARAVFGSQVDLVLDGEAPGGAGSTLVGLRHGKLCCLRQGPIVFAEIEKAIV